MQSIVRRFLSILRFLGLTTLSTITATAVIAVWHMMNTPQPLESLLPGEARIYRWKHGHIFYKLLGAPEAPPLLLLHAPGIGASAHEMHKIMPLLAEHYRVYAPDLLGFGLSDHPHIDYSADTYITLCHDFLAEVVSEPAILLASGLSCNYAVAVAARFPDLCRGLILISPTALLMGELDGERALLPGLAQFIQSPLIGSLLYPLVSNRLTLRYTLEQRRPGYTTSELDYLYATTHQLGAQYAPLALMAGKLTCDVSRMFETLQQPVLIIWGARELNSIRSLLNQRGLAPKTQVVILEDSGAEVHQERPEAVIANIREWSEAGKAKVAVAAAPAPPEPILVAAAENVSAEPGETVVEAYCVKCKKKVPMQNLQATTTKNGRPALRGNCPVCGTGLYRIGQA